MMMHQEHQGALGIGEAGVGSIDVYNGGGGGSIGDNGSSVYPSMMEMNSDKPWSAAYYSNGNNGQYGALAITRNIKDPEQKLAMERANDAVVHTRMENSFLEIQAKLEEVNAELEGQRNQILSLQDIRARCKSELSAWRQVFKKKKQRTDESYSYRLRDSYLCCYVCTYGSKRHSSTLIYVATYALMGARRIAR